MSTWWKRDNTLTSNNLQIVFEIFFFCFFLFENIVDSPQNQSRNTCEKRELPRLSKNTRNQTE